MSRFCVCSCKVDVSVWPDFSASCSGVEGGLEISGALEVDCESSVHVKSVHTKRLGLVGSVLMRPTMIPVCWLFVVLVSECSGG